MNKRQKIVVLIGVLAVAGMMLYPPWKTERAPISIPPPLSRNSGVTLSVPEPLYQVSAGYAPLFMPPDGSAYVDASRLGIQCAAVAVLTFGLYVFVGHKKD